MNILFKLLFFIPLFALMADEPVLMEWDENYKLSWEDFKGKPDSRSQFVASTQSGLAISYSYELLNNKPTLTTEVTSNFYPNDSWYKPEQVNEVVLNHEQGHFDISEIHARKLRKAFSEFNFTRNVKSEVSNIYNSIERERQNMQKRYDRETNHSMNLKNEIEWQEFISEELRKLEKWK